jgi:hypothetical protein
MSRTRALPVLLVLVVLVGVDALWVMTRESGTRVEEPVVIRHSTLEGIEYYRGNVRMAGCGELRTGIAAGSSSEVSLELTLEESPGPCAQDSMHSFALMYDSAGDPTTFAGVRIGGVSASYRLIEEE